MTQHIDMFRQRPRQQASAAGLRTATSDHFLSLISRLADRPPTPLLTPQRLCSRVPHPSQPPLLPSHGRVLTNPRHVENPI